MSFTRFRLPWCWSIVWISKISYSIWREMVYESDCVLDTSEREKWWENHPNKLSTRLTPICWIIWSNVNFWDFKPYRCSHSALFNCEKKKKRMQLCLMNSLGMIFILDLTNTVDQQQCMLLLSLEMRCLNQQVFSFHHVFECVKG